MAIHKQPIEERIAWLFDLAARHGESFRSPEPFLARERYLAEHPTAIAALDWCSRRLQTLGDHRPCL